MIWIIPAAIGALSFFKLGSFYVWTQVMSLLLKVLAALCMLLLTGVASTAMWRVRRHKNQ